MSQHSDSHNSNHLRSGVASTMTNYHWQSNNHKRSGVDDLVLLNQVTIDECSFTSFNSILFGSCQKFSGKNIICFPELPIRGEYLIWSYGL